MNDEPRMSDCVRAAYTSMDAVSHLERYGSGPLYGMTQAELAAAVALCKKEQVEAAKIVKEWASELVEPEAPEEPAPPVKKRRKRK